jgi:hypothetical protein
MEHTVESYKNALCRDTLESKPPPCLHPDEVVFRDAKHVMLILDQLRATEAEQHNTYSHTLFYRDFHEECGHLIAPILTSAHAYDLADCLPYKCSLPDVIAGCIRVQSLVSNTKNDHSSDSSSEASIGVFPD